MGSGKAAATLDTFTPDKLAKAELVMEEKLGSETLVLLAFVM